MADIFVSYARADRARVVPLVAALEAQGWSVWWDPEIAPGQEFDRQISAELDAAKAVIVVWTPVSVDSRWVRGEAREAADRGILVPVRFERTRLPIDARSLHTTDLDQWGENPESAEFKSLLRAVSALLVAPQARGDLLRQTLEFDPSFLPAVFLLYEAHFSYMALARGHRAEVRKKIEALAERVTVLAPDHWATQALRARVLIDHHDFLGAESLIEKARRSFHGATVPDELVWLHERFVSTVGRHNEAIEIAQEMIRKDPLSYRLSTFLQAELHIMGLADEEEAEYTRSRDLTGNKSMVERLALFRIWDKAEPQDILAQYRRYVASFLSGFEQSTTAFEQLEAVLFDQAAACALLRQAFDDPRFQNAINTLQLANFASLYGDTDLALAGSRRAYVDMNFFPHWDMWYPEAAEVRKDPRFKQIVRDLGLYDYWRGSGKWGDFARPVGDDDFEIIR